MPLARPSRLLLTLLPALAVACSDQGFNVAGDPVDGNVPAMLVEPARIDFGTLGQADEALVKTFTIKSVGATDLTVDGVELLGDAGSFTILSEQTSFVLPPGTSQEIEVAFSPLGAYDQMGQAIVSSDDPLNPEALVELLGAGAVPELAIQPDPVSFGTGYIGCTEDTDVYLSNVGNDVLIVTSIGYEGDEHGAFTELSSPSLPLTLQPGESGQILLSFLPTAVQSYTGSLVVESNEPQGVREAAIDGAGEYAGDYTDSWEIPADPPSDIMFLVDQSGSMDDNQRLLGDNFTTFITSLTTYTTDWQVAVVNDDDGCNNSGILTRTSAGYANTFSSAVTRGGGMYTESLLTPAANGVDKTDSAECNAGFMREEAILHIIMVSDEPEQSPGSWATLVDRIIAKKGSESHVRLSAIAGPASGGGGCADPGTGYMEAVAATGGVYLNICDNWATPTNMAMLAEASVYQDTYALARTPVPSTIWVEVNGSPRTTGWTYDAATNSVIFSSSIPTEGDQVDIHYSGNATCD